MRRTIRLYVGMTVEELANALNCSTETIEQFESDRSVMNSRIVKFYSDTLDIPYNTVHTICNYMGDSVIKLSTLYAFKYYLKLITWLRY